VERLVERARHIEVQVIGDRHGGLIHLFERDCSLQRRHQKVIEEAPAPFMADGVRRRLHDAALAIARAAGYVNAGTLEFLVEGNDEDASIFFMEMNTRLQVEHPVTEAITGLDLVELQLRVASGDPLPIRQNDVRASGHAIEARICAEDSRRLLPQEGTIRRYRAPSGEGVRIDSGIRTGQRLGLDYDSLMAKLVVHESSRAAASDTLLAALERFEILGIRHNIAFLMAVMRRPEFRSAHLHTGFIDEHLAELTTAPNRDLALAAAAAATIASLAPAVSTEGIVEPIDPWTSLGRVDW
jgi:acetyl/propionyl-CoA carboxylase alpha subunit